MVIWAGLAGLTAAATAARARRPVVVVEAHTAGGRASTDELSGYRLNQGPHALGRGARPGGYCTTWGCPTAVTDRHCVAPASCTTASWPGYQ